LTAHLPLEVAPITIKIRLTDAPMITVMRPASGQEKKILFLDMISVAAALETAALDGSRSAVHDVCDRCVPSTQRMPAIMAIRSRSRAASVK
jgi:hypothetical protein